MRMRKTGRQEKTVCAQVCANVQSRVLKWLTFIHNSAGEGAGIKVRGGEGALKKIPFPKSK
ncbi:hypothetical protein C5S31_01055 [ANME-1 cluster archaeon GoMg2]|nr:hypothetical protein [ANME-1 cluster archaeon GoMg2]